MKELKKYLRTHISSFVMGIVFSLVTILFVLMMADSIMQSEFDWIELLLSIVFGVICYISISSAFEERKTLSKIFDRMDISNIITDFQNSSSHFSNNLRLGREFIYGKHSNRVIGYEEVKQMYLYIKKKNGVEVERLLRVVDVDFQTVDLCKLKVSGKSDDEMKLVLSFIMERNPKIELGYK